MSVDISRKFALVTKGLMLGSVLSCAVAGGEVWAADQAVSSPASAAAAAPASALSADSNKSSFSDTQKSEIEHIVREYLLSHPELLMEMAKSLDQMQQIAQEEVIAHIIDSLRKDEMIPVRGDRNAKHYLIEFYDVNCGYCKVVRPYTTRLHEENKDLAIFYIEFPILSATSVKAAAMALALYQEDPAKYFKYQDAIMTKGVKVTDESQLKDIFKSVGADYDKLSKKAQSDETIQIALRRNMDLGQRMGVQGTPFFVLDGHVIRGAVRDYAVFENILKSQSTK